jgi:hypothetical protein
MVYLRASRQVPVRSHQSLRPPMQAARHQSHCAWSFTQFSCDDAILIFWGQRLGNEDFITGQNKTRN